MQYHGGDQHPLTEVMARKFQTNAIRLLRTKSLYALQQ